MTDLPKIRYVQVQTDSRCNANCVFCPYVESWHHDNPGVMSDELFAKVLHDLEPWREEINGGKFCPYFMNEPLLDGTIFAKIRRIQAAFPHTQVEISTNAVLLNNENIGRLIETLIGRPHEVWVSHHGIDAQTLQHVMGVSYEKVYNNTINLLKQANGRLRIKLYGAGASRCGRFKWFSSQQYRDYWNRELSKHGIAKTNLIISWAAFHDRAGTIHRRDRQATQLCVGKVRQIGPGHPPFWCDRLGYWLHILYDGTIRLCCMDYHGEVPLPNVRDMTLLEYFRSNAFRELSDRVTGRQQSAEDFLCKRCTLP